MQSIYCALITCVKQAYHIAGKLFRLYSSQFIKSYRSVVWKGFLVLLSLEETTFLAYTVNQKCIVFFRHFHEIVVRFDKNRQRGWKHSPPTTFKKLETMLNELASLGHGWLLCGRRRSGLKDVEGSCKNVE